NEIEVEAANENLTEVQTFVDEHLEAAGCPVKAKMQIGVAVEEIFVNIALYAYHPGPGRARVRVEVSEDPAVVTVTFLDRGVPYDPLAKEDPDLSLPASDRKIGGLGIFMTNQFMDDVIYE
ncbi:MAG: ATP-binding protein, partial [Lachnospiraceae bacterium]|nr:ATP-binding protein [Lachnospiraceae bacterium]